MSSHKTTLPRLFLAAYLISPQLCHSSDFMFNDSPIWRNAEQYRMYLNNMTLKMIQDEEMLVPPAILYQHDFLPKFTDYYTPDIFYPPLDPLEEFDTILDDQLVEANMLDIFPQNPNSTIPTPPHIKMLMVKDSEDAPNDKPIQRKTFSNPRAPKLKSSEKDRIILAILMEISPPPHKANKAGWEDLAIATKPLWDRNNNLSFIAFRDFLTSYKRPFFFSENQNLILYNLKKGADRVHYKRKKQR